MFAVFFTVLSSDPNFMFVQLNRLDGAVCMIKYFCLILANHFIMG